MNNEYEVMMADTLKRTAPELISFFMDAISRDGVSQEEIDQVRQMVLGVLRDRDMYPQFVEFLVSSGLVDREDAPKQFDIGFVMTMLGLVGIAQEIASSSQ